MSLKGKRVLITGGGSGLGAELARRFADQGAGVVIAGRQLTALRAVEKSHPGLQAIAADVTDEGSVIDLFRKAGPCDIVIANAERAQLAHLRKENHRLRMQLQQGQSTEQPPLLNDQQQWFAVGGGVGVLGFLLGVLTTRGRRRRQWLN